jgi:hypothetical protein
MTATTIRAGTPYPAGLSNAATRAATYVGQFIGGIEDGREIAARYFELSRLSRTELARRALNRPCDLSDLMSQPYGHALGRH